MRKGTVIKFAPELFNRVFFRNSAQYKNAKIANPVLAMLLQMNYTNEVRNIET